MQRHAVDAFVGRISSENIVYIVRNSFKNDKKDTK